MQGHARYAEFAIPRLPAEINVLGEGLSDDVDFRLNPWIQLQLGMYRILGGQFEFMFVPPSLQVAGTIGFE
jgi:hypothetical protein